MRRPQGMSIARLAEHLGLSEGTVSRALNNYPDISAKTRERVTEAARTMGYAPSSIARRLARGVVEAVGFVMPERDARLSYFLAEMLHGVAIELSARDWDLVVAAVPDGQRDLDVFERLIRTGKVGGFIITRPRQDDPRVDYLKSVSVPFVSHGRTDDNSNYAWLDIDNEKAFVDAVSYLVELGHRRIAHIGGDPAFNFAVYRRLGYERAMAKAGLPVLPGYIAVNADDGVDGDRAMAEMLELDQPPTAVVCVTDAVALGAMRAISRAGLEPGKAVSVIGYDGLSIGMTAHPPLTTMSQSSHEAGQEIARMMMALADGAEPADLQTLWEAELTVRASANPPVN